jgi:predicted MFS family arabinose efflux permease
MMLIAGLTLNAVANLLFTLATSKIVLLGARMMIGLTLSVLVRHVLSPGYRNVGTPRKGGPAEI